MSKRIRFQLTPGLITRLLAGNLYRDRSAALAELVRNGIVATLPDDADWQQISVIIKIHLRRESTDGSVLYILDHGVGFTEAHVIRYCDIGSDDEAGTQKGASQKRLGKLGTFALMDQTKLRIPTAGFQIITRTSPRGPIKLYDCTVQNLLGDGVEAETITENGKELGPFAGGKLPPTFALLRMPYCVFETAEEIRAEFGSCLPRRADSKILVLVNDKPLAPPALPSFSHSAGKMVAYMERSEDVAGIELADVDTGIVCAKATELGNHLPYPINHPNLAGVIFIPGLLRHQNTSRSSLDPNYLRAAEWKQIREQLALQVSAEAQKLLGKIDVFSDSATGVIDDLQNLFDKAFGEATLLGPRTKPKTTPTIPPKKPPTGGGKGGGGPVHPPDDGGTDRRKVRGIKIGEKEFLLRPNEGALPAWLGADRVTIYISQRWLKAAKSGPLRKSPQAVLEQMLMHVLIASTTHEAADVLESHALVRDAYKALRKIDF